MPTAMHIKYFGTPGGYMLKDPNNNNQDSTVATLVYNILAGTNNVTELLDLITKGGQDDQALSESMKDDNQWIPVSDDAGNQGYEVSGGNSRMLIMSGAVPDQYQAQIPTGAISKYTFVNTFNANLNTSVAHGVGFYVVNGAEAITDIALTTMFITYMKNIFKATAQAGPQNLPDWDISEIESADENIQNDTIQELGDQLPEDIDLSISIDADMTAAAGLAVSEVVACACTGLLVGVTLGLIFFIINDFVIETYEIRYSIVNLSNTLTLQLTAPYYDNVDTNQLPDIIGNPNTKTNIFPNVNLVFTYDKDTGSIHPNQPVMHIGSFQVGNDNKVLEGLGILLKMVQYTETRALLKDTSFQNLFAAYEVHRLEDNQQGVAVNDNDTDAETIYDNLTSSKSITVNTTGGGITITQMTNELSGVSDNTYDVVLIIQDSTN